MESGTVFLATLAVLTVGTASLCAYLYGLFRLGCAVSAKWAVRQPLAIGVCLVAAPWTLLPIIVALSPVEPFWRLPIGLSLFILHAQPFCLGYCSGRIARREEDERRWAKNTDDWLAEWECRPSEGARDDPTL